MQLIRGRRHLRESLRGCVVTIGGYDGIHLGHQALLERLKEHGRRLSRPTMMLTFEPLPREHFSPTDPPARITTLRERTRLICDMGLDALCMLRFCTIRNTSGEQFAQMLATEFHVPAIVVGHDFRFGKQGEASAKELQEAGQHLGFTVDVVPPVLVDGQRVSSTAIRKALDAGDLKSAERWLGRPYSMRGRVVRGRQLGREFGYPTANLRLQRRRSPLAGIFAVRVHGVEAQALPGVASLGTRPTVDGVEPLLEAHIFDFSGDLYGREIEVEFVQKLREELRFDSVEALIVQMNQDAADARSLFRI
jgi:riboflavin kinase/FMN adenylyltransferase